MYTIFFKKQTTICPSSFIVQLNPRSAFNCIPNDLYFPLYMKVALFYRKGTGINHFLLRGRRKEIYIWIHVVSSDSRLLYSYLNLIYIILIFEITNYDIWGNFNMKICIALAYLFFPNTKDWKISQNSKIIYHLYI